jgi:cytochrome b561
MSILDEIEGQTVDAGRHQARQSHANIEASALEQFAPKCRKVFVPLSIAAAFIPVLGWIVTMFCWVFIASFPASLNAQKTGTAAGAVAGLYLVIMIVALTVAGWIGSSASGYVLTFFFIIEILTVIATIASTRHVEKVSRVARAAADYINQQSEY